MISIYIILGLVLIFLIVVGEWIVGRIKGRRLLNSISKGDTVTCKWAYAASLFDSEGDRYFKVSNKHSDSVWLIAKDTNESMRFTLSQLADFRKVVEY